MRRKKSRFWLFIFSLMPGAGEMYLGFMKMGLSLMLGFMVLSGVVSLTDIGALTIFPITMYIYSFFHANNLGALNDAEFYSIQDQYLFGMEGLDSSEKMRNGVSTKYRKIAAVVMILIGVVMLWNLGFDLLVDLFGGDNAYLMEIRYFMNHRMPRAVIAVAVIWIGISLIRGKKADYVEGDTDAAKKQQMPDMQNDIIGQNAPGEQSDIAGQNMQDGQNNE